MVLFLFLVVVACVAVIIILAILIMGIVIIMVRWNKKRKMVPIGKEEGLMMAEKDGQRSPSSEKEVYYSCDV